LTAEEAKAAKQAERQVQNELRQARNNKAKRNSIMEKGSFEDCGEAKAQRTASSTGRPQ
jgi:hypothetical protein